MATPPLAEFYLTDGDEYINLLSTRGGFAIQSWTPATPEPKGGGIFQNSPLSEGRQLVARYYDNAFEDLTLVGRAGTADLLIEESQRVRRLMEKAISYWTSDWQSTPVYAIARGIGETNVRYALIHDYRAPGDGNPFASPFTGSDGNIFGPWSLILERSHWQAHKPGSGECIPISGRQDVLSLTRAYPTGSTDDAYVDVGTTSIVTAGTFLVSGNVAGSVRHSGIRFRSVAIPAGATITQAFIRMVAPSNQSGTPCTLQIYGESSATPAAFSTYANFVGRTLTTASQNWTVAALKPDEDVTTPDITDVIQEIVDLGGWASGNNLVVFIRDNGSTSGARRQFASFDNPLYGEPELVVTYEGADVLGQAATCTEKVYIANKQNLSNLTHIFYYDASGPSFSSNLMAAALPTQLLPTTPAAGDIIYLISDTSAADSGPFNSTVWNVVTAQTNITQVVYEYWNAAWTAFVAIQDNTGVDVGGNIIPFSLEGVGSWHWNQPADWATTTINGITGYIIRMRIVSVGASPTAPQQGTRYPYSVTWGNVEMAESAALGDLPPLVRMRFWNEAENGASVPALYGRLLAGVRSMARGVDFSAYLNAADEQNPPGLTVAAVNTAAFANDPTTPTGRRITWASGGTSGLNARARFTFNDSLGTQYYGRFRIFAYVQQVGGSVGDTSVRLAVYALTPTLTDSIVSQTVEPQVDVLQVLDFGSFVLPGTNELLQSEIVDTFRLEVQAGATTSRTLHIYQLFLLPIDEFAIDAISPRVSNSVAHTRYLALDSLLNPREMPIRTLVYNGSNDRVRFRMQPITAAPAQVQANTLQRVWVTAMQKSDTYYYLSSFSLVHSLEILGTARYLSMRGAR